MSTVFRQTLASTGKCYLQVEHGSISHTTGRGPGCAADRTTAVGAGSGERGQELEKRGRNRSTAERAVLRPSFAEQEGPQAPPLPEVGKRGPGSCSDGLL